MGRRDRRRLHLRADATSRLSSTERRVLLAGTALVTTLIASAAVSTPANAQAIVIVSNFPISFINTRDCVFIGTCAAIATFSPSASVNFTNRGDFAVLGFDASAIFVETFFRSSPITITNSGDLATAAALSHGIEARTRSRNSSISIVNSGDIATIGFSATGIYGRTDARNSKLSITNSGDIATRGILADGIYGVTASARSPLIIHNSGRIEATGARAFGIEAMTLGPLAPATIENSGEVAGHTAGIYSYSRTSTSIINQAGGSISAQSDLAIGTEGASTKIDNSGIITGFVDLTGRNDTFFNRSGGEFVLTETAPSDFGGGSDLFRNFASGTLRAASRGGDAEKTRFVGLERFENQGLITMADGQNKDEFRICNTPGGTLTFVGSGNSTLAVDAFLGGPGSTSDVFIVEGNTGGRTRIQVHNTNSSSAQFDPVGIPVVFVDGNVDANGFYLNKPIHAGFFDYDLFFVPTGSGFFELKNHPGGGSHLLPHLVTVTHETFHNTSETWFDQSTDLRVLLARGAVCDDPGQPEDIARCQQLYNFTPGVWLRGAGTWLDLADTATTRANGRTYHHSLDRELDIWTVESGIDFGMRELFTPDDILVFGILGGAVESTLDYKSLERTFNMRGGEVGTYATYLNGGLFVDTLFKVLFAELDPKEVRGFPDTLDNTAFGFRTDTGYRFGGFRYGPFIEPLATIAVSWSSLDDFVLDGNAIDFDDDENVRGRVGLRLGTSMRVWEATSMEPFVTGSLWGTLSGAHYTTLTSTNTVFEFTDEPEDLWGVVSGGVNFFNPGAQTSVFAKVDYTFADQTEGLGIRGGLRYNW